MRGKTLLSAALLAATLTLAACGGGGGSPASVVPPSVVPPDEIPPDDPAVVRLGRFIERTDTLLLSGRRTSYSVSALGETVEETLYDAYSCKDARCTAPDGTEVTVRDLLAPAGGDVGVSLGSRGGFDTLTSRSALEVSESLPGVTVTAAPTVNSYGFWGEHGFAAVQTADGPLSGAIDGAPLTGDFATTSAYALGDASGTNPAGTGGATWTGIAEAVSTDNFERHEGEVTLTIADLADPSVRVAFDVPGQAIGAPGWADMPLTSGRFASGTAGEDYLEGAFHGPGHEEAWGVFDTRSHLGAFGAKRVP